MLREYALKSNFTVVREFVDVETAKMAGRKNFGEMVRFLENTPECRAVIAEKADRFLAQLEESLLLDQGRTEAHVKSESERLNSRLAQIRNRLEQAYIDKLDGKITKEYREANSTVWEKEQETIIMTLRELGTQKPNADTGRGPDFRTRK